MVDFSPRPATKPTTKQGPLPKFHEEDSIPSKENSYLGRGNQMSCKRQSRDHRRDKLSR
jgi:hypothetical protein